VTVAIRHASGVRYPARGAFFSPSEAFPEYRHGHLASEPNAVYPLVRQLLFDAGLDRERFGTPDWNPLGQYVRPGASVFVLCNFVYHRRPQESEQDLFAKCIHGSVLRALVDYVLIAAGPRGRVRFGNSPLQGARWDDVLEQTGAAHTAAFYRERGLPVEPLDLRQYVVDRSLLGNVRHIDRRERPDEVVEVDLSADSLLSPIADEVSNPRFRVMDYDPQRTEAFHAGRSHRYVVHRAVLEADTVISLSKLKTHEKVGITCGLKGFVGTVAQKDCLAHHRFGSPKTGGDEYPARLWFLQPVSKFQNWLAGRPQGAPMQKPLQVVDWTARRVLKRTGMRMAGAWHGNDTAWRMSVDLARVVHHADVQGAMHAEQQRTHLSLIDGIVAGEGEGPLNPDPVDTGTLLFSDDVALGDRVACRWMGLEPQAIPLIREAFVPMTFPVTRASADPEAVLLNGAPLLETELHAPHPFRPAPGWAEHLRAPERTIAGVVRAKRLESRIDATAHEYALATTEAEKHREQLRLLNLEWKRIRSEHPYFRELNAPEQFDSLQQFLDTVPVTTRDVVREHGPRLASNARPAEFTRMTGGSTSQPVQLPAWKSEQAAIQPAMWWGRSWYGITPASRLFMLWGHSHLLGKGAAGWVKAQRLKASDRLLGYHRFSAYDLRPEAMRRAADALNAERPEYVIGYSVALDRFARVNADRRRELRSLGLKAIIATAEGFPSPDSAARLEELFGCPVAMEYGSVETGPIAYTRSTGGYVVFWRQYLLEGEPSATGFRVRVTSLYPRAFPLVRYDLGDEIELPGAARQNLIGITSFARVIGRCNDVVELTDGTVVHSEVFSHALRPCSSLDGFQIVHAQGRDLRIRYTSRERLSERAVEEIRERLARAHPLLGGVELEWVEALPQTVAGKTRMVVNG
jgi:uncharacterized protein (DUF362 family)/phenylacetate-coenzyme A ligase PaaK-like adenylate-forming protein